MCFGSGKIVQLPVYIIYYICYLNNTRQLIYTVSTSIYPYLSRIFILREEYSELYSTTAMYVLYMYKHE